MKKLSFMMLLAAGLVFSMGSCKNDANTGSAEAAPAVVGTSAVGSTGTEGHSMPAASTPAVPTGPTTVMSFGESTFDFGEIMDGEKVEHVYTFTNTGKEPLVISNAKGSCGCTVPDWPKEPIKPGDQGEIKVVYNSKGKGKVGGKNETKTVTITANTEPADTRIFIKGIVNKEG